MHEGENHSKTIGNKSCESHMSVHIKHLKKQDLSSFLQEDCRINGHV